MRNTEDWKPSKVIRKGQFFRASLSRDNSTSYYVRSVNLDFYVKYIREFATGGLLDCGCGLVPYFDIYKDLVSSITCTDWQNSLHDNRHVDVFSNLNERLEFDDRSFDTVLLTDVLEHIYTPVNLLLEIQRVLKPSGKIILTVPFLYRIHEEPHDYQRFTEYCLRRMLQDNGFIILKLEPYGGFLDVFFDMLNKAVFRSPGLARILVPLAKAIKHTWINKRLNTSFGNRFPIGYILCAEKK
jgi:SAM-dependent methyltransferase